MISIEDQASFFYFYNFFCNFAKQASINIQQEDGWSTNLDEYGELVKHIGDIGLNLRRGHVKKIARSEIILSYVKSIKCTAKELLLRHQIPEYSSCNIIVI